MKLRKGQAAPDFDAEDIYGRRVSLSAYRGRMVLLTFNRDAVCPLCVLRTYHLMKRYSAYRNAGLEVVAFFESSAAQTHAYLDAQRIPFPVVADRALVVYGKYRLESSLFRAARAYIGRRAQFREAARLDLGGSTKDNLLHTEGHMGRLPGDFLIDQNGAIRLAHYGHDAGDFMLFSELERAAFGGSLTESATGTPVASYY